MWVEILNSNLVSQGPIQFVNMTAQLFYNAVGSWSMLVPYTDALWDIMMAGDFIVSINWCGLFTFGGKCEQPGYQDSVPNGVDANTYPGPFITLSGGDYMALIANRIAFPNPAAAWTAQTATATDPVSAVNLETAIKHYVNNNVGPGALAARRVNLLNIGTNLNRGPNVSYTVKFGTGVDLNLLDVIRALLAAGNTPMGVSITRVPATHSLTFDVYIPRNLTGKAWFSEQLGNLTSIAFSITDPTCTDAYLQGSGTTFIAKEVTTPVTQWNKTEQFINNATETDANNNNTAAQQAIFSGAAGPIMGITAADIPYLTFGRDYWLGDIVSVEVRPGNVYSDVVSSVVLTADPSQSPEISVVPTVGQSQAATDTDQTIIGQLTSRIRALETKIAAQ